MRAEVESKVLLQVRWNAACKKNMEVKKAEFPGSARQQAKGAEDSMNPSAWSLSPPLENN